MYTHIHMTQLMKSIRHLYHFTRPTLSQYQNIYALANEVRRDAAEDITRINNTFHTRYPTVTDQIKHTLSVSDAAAQIIAQSSFKLSLYHPKSLTFQQADYHISHGLTLPDIPQEDLELDFDRSPYLPRHFSQQQGTPNISQYMFEPRVTYVFNLPTDITEDQIKAAIEKALTIKVLSIKISLCILGLPAYARVQCMRDDAVRLPLLPTLNIEVRNRLLCFKTILDSKAMELTNRRLVLSGQTDIKSLILCAYKYGRLLHIDMPHKVRREPSVSDVKEYYHGYDGLVQIHTMNENGKISSEYYPQIHAEDGMMAVHQQYEKRMQFAQQVMVREGKQSTMKIEQSKYLVLTFSTPEEAKGFYFGNAYERQIQLMKKKEVFEYDGEYRKRLLQRINRQSIQTQKEAGLRDYKPEKEPLSPQENILLMQKDSMMDTEFTLSKKATLYKRLVDRVKKKVNPANRASFEEVTEKALFGRTIHGPKTHKPLKLYKKRKIINMEQEAELEYGIMGYKEKEEALLNLSFLKRRINQTARKQSKREVKKKDKFDQNKFQKQFLDKLLQYENNKEIEPQQAQEELQELKTIYQQYLQNNRFQSIDPRVEINEYMSDNDNVNESKSNQSAVNRISKYSFCSTVSPRCYRPRTILQSVHYKRRLSRFMRYTINTFLGVFPQSQIQDTMAAKRGTFINPQDIRDCAGNEFLVEEQLHTILQFHSNYSQAQTLYDRYFKAKELVTSSTISIPQLREKCLTQRIDMFQSFMDIGVVESSYKAEGLSQEHVKALNTLEADVGEEYRYEGQHLVKVRKIEPLCPLDRVKHIQTLLAQLTPQQYKILERSMPDIIETELIPDSVRDAFHIQCTTLDQALSTYGVHYDIKKKDLQMVARLNQISDEELINDVSMQIEIEKQRIKKRQTKEDDMVKDTSNVQTKNREGYFQVSRYRQM